MISAIILAAGSSNRMKLGNKLLLKKNNTTIIQKTFQNIKSSKVNEIIIVLGKDPEIFKKEIKDKNITFTINQNYHTGMSSSIKKGLEKIDQRSIATLICLGDMPLIKTSTYNKIIDTFYKNKEKNIIPYFENKKGNPVLFNKFFFKKLKMVEGDNGAKFFIKKNFESFLKLEVIDQGVIKDIDNDEQYYSFLNNA